MPGLNVAVLGATGVVGHEMLSILEERRFPVKTLRLLASARSVGKTLRFGGEEIPVQRADAPEAFRGVDLVLASSGSSSMKHLAPAIKAAGAILIDNSSAFRMDPAVPLVVPEVNPEVVLRHQGVIANPNCVAIILCVAVAPLHRVSPIERIVVATYQSASGAGLAAMQELESQTRTVLGGGRAEPKALPHPIAFNVFSHNTAIGADGYNGEESKVIAETKKILDAPSLRVTATCVRVPVLRAHSEAINLQFGAPFPEERARDVLKVAPGVEIVDDRERNTFPMPLVATGKDAVFVGRIRQDVSQPDQRGLDLFVSGDQLRKGAALNAIQIAERLL
ncbi:MAG TPA: aspartate-semialdehyde dehydrogenase [Myxococcota bacterium]|jgi:aspartate-semialdehyde dehydrogenase|nr:aspartate-semialdehyde dehydrogenase [Myxococcota bacterium]